MKRGHLIIVSAPSGSGKSTIINEIIKDESLRLQFSISATNRPPRRGEADGVNYYFLSTEQFKAAIENDELIEYEEVYRHYIDRVNAFNEKYDADIENGDLGTLDESTKGKKKEWKLV